MREIFGPSDSRPLLGAMNLALCGDFGQLPPVQDDPVWAQNSWRAAIRPSGKAGGRHARRGAAGAAGSEGKLAGLAGWKEACGGTNFRLTTIWRQGPGEVQLRDVLRRLRDGESTQADVDALNARHVSRVPHLDPAQAAAMTLAQTRAAIASINRDDMEARGTPIVVARAVDEGGSAAGLGADDFRGLSRVIMLQEGARYLLTANLWLAGKLYNGTLCDLHSVVYPSVEEQARGIIAYAVMSSAEYTGPVFNAAIPGSFRVPTLTRPSGTRPGVTRTQLPLLAAAGLTVHKSQGMTLHRFFGLFGDRELAMGSTYVMLSRCVALAGMTFRDALTLKRLVGLSQSDRADMRRAFEFELDGRVVQTLTEWAARAGVPPDRRAEIVAALAEAQAERSAATARAEQRKAGRAAAAKATAAIEMDKRKAAAAAKAAAKAAQPAAKRPRVAAAVPAVPRP